jgi:hypothetical protein
MLLYVFLRGTCRVAARTYGMVSNNITSKECFGSKLGTVRPSSNPQQALMVLCPHRSMFDFARCCCVTVPMKADYEHACGTSNPLSLMVRLRCCHMVEMNTMGRNVDGFLLWEARSYPQVELLSLVEH